MNMFERTYKEFDNVKPSAKMVDKAVKSAIKADETKNTTKIYKFPKRKIITCALAACMVVVFVCTFVFGLRYNPVNKPQENTEYGFAIRANASQVSQLSDYTDGSVIGAYAGELTGGWAMYQKLEKQNDTSPTFFQSYCLNYLNIEGEGIDSITFKANAEGTYFALSPSGYYSSSENNSEKVQNESEKFTDLSLSNSLYTAEELCEYKDGLSFGDIYCDTFTYTNVDNDDSVNLSCKIEYVIESSHSNSQQSQLLDKIWLYEEEITKEKEAGILSYDKLENLYLELSDISTELQKLVLEDATIDVTVEFVDGSFHTKTLRMGLAQMDDETFWLTISE